jgi:hypothetical protein
MLIFLSCNAKAKVKLAKTGHGPHYYTLVVICVVRLLFVLFGCYLCCSVVIYVVRLLFVLFYILFVCKYVLPPGDNPIVVNKYIISHKNANLEHYISYTLSWYFIIYTCLIFFYFCTYQINMKINKSRNILLEKFTRCLLIKNKISLLFFYHSLLLQITQRDAK